jgi:hypothetical protein
MLKNSCLFDLIFLVIFLQSCFFNDLAPEKKETQQQYESFLLKNKNKIELIADKCFRLQIKYAVGDSIFKIIPDNSLKDVIDAINYVSLITLPDYVAYDFKLNIKENKCVDFYLTKIFSGTKDKNVWSVRVIDKSPCF